MKDGEWLVSPDAIAFDFSGRLINGQHRLKAIVNSGETVTCLVVWNLPPEAFKIADVGVKRTGGDVLRIEGFKNPEELAAVCRLVALWSQGRLEECNQYENVENTTIVDIATTFSEELSEIVKRINKKKNKKIYKDAGLPRSLMAFVYFAYSETFPTRMEEFYNGLILRDGFTFKNWADECGMSEEDEDYEDIGHPISLLEDKIIGRGWKSYTRDRMLGFIIKAVNHYCTKEPLKRLRYRQSDNFPETEAPVRADLQDNVALATARN